MPANANPAGRRPGGAAGISINQPCTNSQNPAPRQAFRLVLKPRPGTNAYRQLARGLKYLLRSCGLRATSVEEVK